MAHIHIYITIVVKIKIKIKTLFIVEYRYIKTLARCAIVRHDIIKMVCTMKTTVCVYTVRLGTFIKH